MREKRCGGLDDVHLGAEPDERLRELEPDCPCTEHEQAARLHAELEHGLVGQVRHITEALDRGNRRTAAGADDDVCRGEVVVADLKRARIDERGTSSTHHDTCCGEMGFVLVARDLLDDIVDALHDGGEVDTHIGDADTEATRVRRTVVHRRRLDERLGRHASVPRALPSQRPLTDQQDPSFQLRRGLRRSEPCRPSPDDGEVEGVTHAGFDSPANTRQALWPPNPKDVVIAKRALTARPTFGT